MAPDPEFAPVTNGIPVDSDMGRLPSSSDDPVTPLESIPPPSSQITLPSTEAPGSPMDPAASFRTEANDDRGDETVIPSSLTPPPSSQVPVVHPNAAAAIGYVTSQRSSLFSPPTTVGAVRREAPPSSEYVAPTPQEVRDASADRLRAMMQSCIVENQRLKTETAHFKLQLNLLSMQQDEDAQRAAIEHDMTRREVEALREAEHTRQARRELSAAAESSRAKYLEIKGLYEDARDVIEALAKKLRVAKKVIREQGDEISQLKEDRQQLRTRIRENREHFNMLRSPGGILHGVLTPKQSVSTPQQSRSTPRQTPRGGRRESKSERDHDQRPFDALIQVLSQENNSAPSTPIQSHRPAPRQPPKHTRNVQSLSSLPTTPTNRSRGDGLLPSVQLVPQTEPVPRFTNRRYLPDSRPAGEDEDEAARRSRESTISVPDNEELARQALASVQKASSSLSRASGAGTGAGTGAAHGMRPGGDEGDEEEVQQSQASMTASEMLRRDPRESIEVASSIDSRDGTPIPAADRRTQTLLSNIARNGEKRKFSGTDDARREATSAPKKLRVGPEPGQVGLGIKY